MTEPTPNSNVKTAIGAGAILALLASNIYLFVQVHDQKLDLAKQQLALTAQIQDLKESASTIRETQQKHYETLSEAMERRSREAAAAANSARSEALKKVDQTRQQLEQEQTATAEKINGDLTAAQQANTQKFAEVSTDVGSVKQQVTSTQSDLQKTIAQLSKVQGDLGVTSGYVATNGKELEALKRLGERNYFEFTLSKGKEAKHVGDIQLVLRKADPKKNKFTVTVMADDKSIEKKDKTINEPVQFYVSKAPHQPYEIVVNHVSKDQISGYLATPKDTLSR
jgi:predicted  nucleic acid-binding Zn-ribbon protein